jgi:hypothetical protein
VVLSWFVVVLCSGSAVLEATVELEGREFIL